MGEIDARPFPVVVPAGWGTTHTFSSIQFRTKNSMLDAKAIAEELALVKDASRPFDFASFREGHLTPV